MGRFDVILGPVLPAPVVLRKLSIPLLVVGLAAPAWAQQPTLLALQLEGAGLPADTVKALDAALREELPSVAGKLKVLKRPALDYAGLREATGCADASNSCLQAIGRTVSAAQVVRATLEGTPEATQLKIVIVEVGVGKVRSYAADLVDVTPDSATELRHHVAVAFGAKRELAPGTVALYVSSAVGKLEGAEVFVDGVAVKPADLGKLAPGRRTLEVRQQGFEPFRATTTVRPGRESRVGVSFTPSRPAAVAEVAPTPTPAPADPTPSIDAAPAASEPAPAVVVTQPPERAGPNYLVPAVLGVGALASAVVATVHGLQVLSAEADHETRCDVPGERDPRCGPRNNPGAECTLPECESARADATVATVFWVVGGVLAASAVTSYIIVDNLADEDDPVIGVLAPAPGGATFVLRY
jgi:hypothetical protein